MTSEKKYKNQSSLQIFKSIINKIKAYEQASRWWGGFSVISFIFLGEWYSVKGFPFYSSLLGILSFMFIGLVNGLINAVFDKKLDIFARKKIMKIFKYISTKEMIFTVLLSSLAGLIVLWFINLNAFLTGIILIIIYVIYVAPPIRLKTKPPFDAIANALMFGIIPFFLGWTITGKQLTQNSIIYGFILGLPVVTYYLFDSLHDIDSDEEFGIQTSCTKLGYNGSIYAGVALWIILIILAVLYFGLYSLVAILSIVCFPLILAEILFKRSEIHLYVIQSVASSLWILSIFILLYIWTYSIIPLLPALVFLIVVIVWIFHFFHSRQKQKTSKK